MFLKKKDISIDLKAAIFAIKYNTVTNLFIMNKNIVINSVF